MASLLFRGGLLFRVSKVAIVDGEGREISRSRAFLRALITWSPLLLIFVALLFTILGWNSIAAIATATAIAGAGPLLLMGGAIYAVIRPQRGIQDHILGTHLVPR